MNRTLRQTATSTSEHLNAVIVDFSEPIGIAFIDLAELIEKRLNKTVDLVSKKGVKKKYFSEIEAEIIYV